MPLRHGKKKYNLFYCYLSWKRKTYYLTYYFIFFKPKKVRFDIRGSNRMWMFYEHDRTLFGELDIGYFLQL